MKKTIIAILLVSTFSSVAATSPSRDKIAEDIATALAASKCSVVTKVSVKYEDLAEIAARSQHTYLKAAKNIMRDPDYRGDISRRADEIIMDVNRGILSCHDLSAWAVGSLMMPLRQ